MTNLATIIIISIIILIIGNSFSLPLPITLFGIWALTSNLLRLRKKQRNKQKQEIQKTQESRYLRKDENIGESEILQNLRKNLEKTKGNEKSQEKNDEANESQIYYDNEIEEKIYTTQPTFNTMAEQQKYYNKKLEVIDKKEEDIKGLSEEDVYAEGYDRDTRYINESKKRLLSNLSVEDAVIYNAILSPKRLKYSRIAKNRS